MMDPYPEKPKRGAKKPSRFKQIVASVLIGALSIPLLISFARQWDESFEDTVIVGYILCVLLFIVYRATVWLIETIQTPVEPQMFIIKPEEFE